MPRGGWRGGGRPTKAAQAKKARLLAEAIAKGPKTSPRVLLQGIMDSPGSTKMEKMKAVELLVKLPPKSVSPSSVDNSERTLVPYSLPRGSSINVKTGEITFPPGVEPLPIEPFKATVDWTKTPLADRRDPAPVVERLEVVDEPTLESESEPAAPLPVRTMDPAPNVQRLRPRERVYTEGINHDRSRRPSAVDPFTHKPREPFDAA